MEFDDLRPPSDFDFREKLVFPRSLPVGIAPSSPELDSPDSTASGGSTTDVSIGSSTTDVSIACGPDNDGTDGELCAEREMPCCSASDTRDDGGGDDPPCRSRELILGPHAGVSAGGGSGGSPVAVGGGSTVAVVGGQKESGAEAGSNVLRSPGSAPPESSAAVKLQKVYRSYRTRRRLADSAVVAEELWWVN